jgi:translation initiation factor 4E
MEDTKTGEAGHRLTSGWAFWYLDKPSGKGEKLSPLNYYDHLKMIAQCRTVEDFFSVYIYLQRASSLQPDTTLNFFRDGHTPMWESFPEGGCWIVRIHHRIGLGVLDKFWESALLACIGE